MSDPRALEIARRELQRLGYLSHRVERFLLRDALEPVGEPRALALLAAKVGLLAGMLLALANTLALASANSLFANSPIDLLPEVLLGPIGLLDDLVVVAATLSRLLNHVHPDVVRSHWPGKGDALDAIQRVTNWTEGFVTRRLRRFVRGLLGSGSAK